MGTHLLVPQYLRIKGFITGVLDGLCIDGRKSRALFKGCISPVITITLDSPTAWKAINYIHVCTSMGQ